MKLGVAYYPEHWPQDRWETDARLMKEAGITRLRVGEFAWHRLEPCDGTCTFDWLENVVALFGRYGIKTILGTPTPTYPAWLHEKYPDLHQVCADGRVKEFGQRQDACKNHPGYRRHARRIVEAMVRRMGRHPDVVAWQTDNEFGCHDTARCYCANCRKAFQEWLRQRFANDINALNRAWGTVFWSQEYNEFSEIVLPRDTADNRQGQGHNPGLVLDFYRFSSDTQVAFQKEQIALLRAHSPGRAITHNLMGLFSHIDYYELAKDLDVVSWDNYPFGANGSNLPPQGLPHDLMRGLKQKNVWVMEQASGPGGWGEFTSTPQPGQMRLWAYQTVARGADMVSFFRWRSCRVGREQYWHGLLYHHGRPQRRYEEAKRIGAEFKRLGAALEGTTVESHIGILYDYDCLWTLEIQPNTGGGFGYVPLATQYDKVFSAMGLTPTAVNRDMDFSSYKVLVCPPLHLCTPETAQRLTDYVRKGGILVLGPRSGVKDAENTIVDDLLPGVLRALAGCYVEEYDAFNRVPGLAMNVAGGGERWRATGIADVLVAAKGTEVLLAYDDHYYKGRPAVTQHKVGRGLCVYVGTCVDDACLDWLFRRLLAAAGIRAGALPAGIEFTRRVKDGTALAFYLNHANSPKTVDVMAAGKDLLAGRKVGKTLELEPFGVAIVREQTTARRKR